MGFTAPIVTVIVVNFNGKDHLSENLSAVCDDDSFRDREVIIVDNASQDGSDLIADDFADRFPFLCVVKSPMNCGYSGGINLALLHAHGRYLVILNMDTIVTPGWLTPLVAFMDTNPNVGAASPMLILRDNEIYINAIGQDIHITGLGFNRGLGKPCSEIGRKPIMTSGIHGAAFIIRKSILDKIGGLDESGFLYHEDVDISCLLHIMGYDIYCVPESVVLHKYFLTMYPQKLYLLERNRVKMLLEYWENTSLLFLTPLFIITELLMWGYCILRGKDFFRAKLASYQWIKQQSNRIKERKSFIRTFRDRSDWQVMKRLKWKYTWDQFIHLGKERGQSTRQPAGGLPVTINSQTGK